MAGVGFEEFSVPPGSELALPPLFGGNILESELETEVEFVDGGLSGDNLQDEEEEESQQRQRELGRRKIQALARRCKEIEQVNERVLNRLHHVQKITRRLKQERRMKAAPAQKPPPQEILRTNLQRRRPPGASLAPHQLVQSPRAHPRRRPPRGRSVAGMGVRTRSRGAGGWPLPSSPWMTSLHSSKKRTSSPVTRTPSAGPSPEINSSITPSSPALGPALISTEPF
nr:TCF3 fusion partner isoform X2 [Caretta caretta]